MTASDFLKRDYTSTKEKAMIEFAKYHVEQSLIQASEKAKSIVIDYGYSSYVVKESILNSNDINSII